MADQTVSCLQGILVGLVHASLASLRGACLRFVQRLLACLCAQVKTTKPSPPHLSKSHVDPISFASDLSPTPCQMNEREPCAGTMQVGQFWHDGPRPWDVRPVHPLNAKGGGKNDNQHRKACRIWCGREICQSQANRPSSCESPYQSPI